MSLPLPEDLGDDLVRLRAFEVTDAAEVFDACRDSLIHRFTTFPEATDVQEVADWIESHVGQREGGEALDLAIAASHDGTLLGAVGLGEYAPEHARAAAGYWLAPGARGKGYATAALRLLSDWALSPPLDLVRVDLVMDIDNAASVMTAEAAGFTREGVLRSYLSAKGRRWDVAI